MFTLFHSFILNNAAVNFLCKFVLIKKKNFIVLKNAVFGLIQSQIVLKYKFSNVTHYSQITYLAKTGSISLQELISKYTYVTIQAVFGSSSKSICKLES